MSNVLIENIEKVHTTEMGVGLIRKNLGLGQAKDSQHEQRERARQMMIKRNKAKTD